MNYVEHHIGDYLKDTVHLSLLEHGVYRRLLDVYYTREGGIPAADAARLIGARTRDERAALDTVLAEFFVLTDGVYSQGRADREIKRFNEKQGKAKASAHLRWEAQRERERIANAMRTHSDGSADAAQTQCEGNALQSPVTSHQSPVTKKEKAATPPARKRAPPTLGPDDLTPEGVDPQHASDWLAVRKAKHLPLTATAWADTKAEAVKAGVAIGEAVRLAAANGWAGFRASWLAGKDAPHVNGTRPLNRQLAVEAENRRVLDAWISQEQPQ